MFVGRSSQLISSGTATKAGSVHVLTRAGATMTIDIVRSAIHVCELATMRCTESRQIAQERRGEGKSGLCRAK